MEEKFLTTEDLMQLFHVCRDTIQEWKRYKKDFPKSVKVGRRNLWKCSDIDKYIENIKER